MLDALAAQLPFHLGFVAIASCWLHRSWWPSWALFLLALLLAALGTYVSPVGLAIIAGTGLVMLAAARGLGQPSIARLVAFAVGLPLLLYHTFDIPGLTPLPVLSDVPVSEDGELYSLRFDFGPLAVGFFYARLFVTPPTAAQMKRVLIWVGGLTLALAAVLIAVGLGLGYVRWDPKWPSFLIVWTIANLLYVAVPEEALFRGLLQDGLRPLGARIAVPLAAVIFGAYHFPWGLANVGLAAVAGLFFGYAYWRTGRIEAAILLHFIVNAIHLLLFTYPRLA
jgi:membrane protease YdiL (CAAX protease family)